MKMDSNISHLIDFRKEANNLYLLFDAGNQGRKVKTKYLPLLCPVCGRVNEDKAIEGGIDPLARIVPKVNALRTRDGFILMNQQGKSVFQEIFGEAVTFKEIENSEPLFLAYPTKVVRVQANQRVYAVGESSQGDVLQPRSEMCPHCGRFYEVTINFRMYKWEQHEILVGLQAEGGWGSIIMWIVPPEQAALLEEAKVPSVRLMS